MPLTASKTDADTSATARVLASGLVPPARTELFMTPIHSSTGSEVAAEAGKGLATSNAIITIRIAMRTVVQASWQRTNAKKPRLRPGKLRIMCPPRARRQRGCELAHVCDASCRSHAKGKALPQGTNSSVAEASSLASIPLDCTSQVNFQRLLAHAGPLAGVRGPARSNSRFPTGRAANGSLICLDPDSCRPHQSPTTGFRG